MPNRFIFLLAIFSFSTSAMPLDIYVSNLGNDKSNGRSFETDQSDIVGPFQSIHRAQQEIRDLKKNGKFKESITIHIQKGKYLQKNPLEFDIRDSGFLGREVHWQAENGPVEIIGAVRVANCMQTDGNIWSCPTAGLDLSKIKFLDNSRKPGNIPGFELFVNSRRLHLARWPDAEWAHIKMPLDERTRFNTIEALPKLTGDISHAQVHILAGNDWYDQFIALAGIDQNKSEISLASNTNYPISSGRRFYIQNIRSTLDSAGEWFYDQANEKILFFPLDNESPKDILISSLQSVLLIKGANYISFNGLSFGYSTDVAISVEKANNIEFRDIEVSNVGTRGVVIKNSNHVSIINSHIHHTGEGGIYSGGGNRNTLEPSDNIIENNHIHNFGMVLINYSPAVALAGVGSIVRHNLIEQGDGLGIWIDGNDHLIEKNEIRHVCEQTSDCGAIYSGRDWTYHGNIIRHNSIHDLFGYGLQNVDISKNTVLYTPSNGVRGVYLDDAVSGFSIIGNLFNNAGAMAIQLGGGRNINIENNIILTNDHALWADYRTPGAEIKKRLTQVPYQSSIWRKKYPKLGEPMFNENWPEGNTISRNIMVSTKPGGLSWRYMLPAQSNLLANNVVWCTAGEIAIDYYILDTAVRRSGASWKEWISQNFEKDSINTDPCVTINGNKATFCAQSPAKKIRFQPIPTDIGLVQ
ncbi:right-handed parallel beta-helix repeat-containing protein [Methylomonas sp. YC3]